MKEVEWKISKELIDYQFAIDFMEKRVEELVQGIGNELIWILEHPPIYTAGISAQESELLSTQFPVYKTGRGGKYTYHGPGQKIIYVVLNLKKRFVPSAPDIRNFIQKLEYWIIISLKEIGIEGFIRQDRIGIWVNTELGVEKKIAAIGLRVRKWITYHGIAINFEPDLNHFLGIVPCGIKEFGVTSVKELVKNYNKNEFDEILKIKFSEVFE